MPSNKAPLFLKIATAGVILFLHFPVLLIILYSTSEETGAFTFPPREFTLRWFEVTWENQSFRDAMWLSLQVAGAATLMALVLGTLAAVALYRSQFFGREAVSLLIILPIALPGIVTGIALRSAINEVGISFGFWTIVVSHATFCIVTVYNNVIARFRRTAYSQIEASMDLGASTFQTFLYVVLPHIATALLAGAMLAFALSFDEIVVTTFTADAGQETLPIWILNRLTRPRDRPVTNVAAVFVIATTLIPILLAYRFTSATSEEN